VCERESVCVSACARERERECVCACVGDGFKRMMVLEKERKRDGRRDKV